MSLYSYKGQEPSPLPLRIRLESGETRSSLKELTQQELEDLGFSGPFTKPEYDIDTQKIEWDNGDYVIKNLTEEELSYKQERELAYKLENIDYNSFWLGLIGSELYKNLRNKSKETLYANTLCTALIALISDAKSGNANPGLIQHYLNVIFFNFDITEDEKLKLLSLMKETNMDSRYTIPDEDFISSHIYHASTNKIITQKPYPSWILIEETGDWTSPIGHMPTPTKEEIESGMYYDWDEDLYQSDNTLGWVLIPLA